MCEGFICLHLFGYTSDPVAVQEPSSISAFMIPLGTQTVNLSTVTI